jgi:hypothetical protein
MKILQDKDHFLHERVKLELHNGQDFFKTLEGFSIPMLTVAETADDNSWINWRRIRDHHVFSYGFEGSDKIISNWLKQSKLAEKQFLLTYVKSNTEVLKVSVNDFISHWDSFNRAGGNAGMVFISDDGELIMEFTDDYKYNLHSNFSIENKPASSQTDIFK